MELATISMDRVEARKAYLEYQGAIREAHEIELDEVRARQLNQDRAIAAGYRQLSLGRQLIRLSDSMAAGGRRERGFPKLAIMRADIETCEMQSWSSGRTRYRPHRADWRDPEHRAASKVMSFEMGEYEGNTIAGISTVPIIPPEFRPRGALSNYHILWEVDRWAPLPKPQITRSGGRIMRGGGRLGDPALLRHLRGDLYAVLAVWDLTEVEKAALDMGAVLS